MYLNERGIERKKVLVHYHHASTIALRISVLSAKTAGETRRITIGEGCLQERGRRNNLSAGPNDQDGTPEASSSVTTLVDRARMEWLAHRGLLFFHGELHLSTGPETEQTVHRGFLRFTFTTV